MISIIRFIIKAHLGIDNLRLRWSFFMRWLFSMRLYTADTFAGSSPASGLFHCLPVMDGESSSFSNSGTEISLHVVSTDFLTVFLPLHTFTFLNVLDWQGRSG
jgi:hypothetical protein